MRTTTLLLLALIPAHALAAQWSLTALHGSAAVTGYSRDASGTEALAFLPDRPSNYALALARDLGRDRVSIEVRRTSADLALRGENTVIVTTKALHAWGAALELAHRLAGHRGQPTLHAGAGVLFEHWDFDVGASDPRWRAAGRGALELGVPVNRRWHAIVRAEVAVGPSLFREDELPEGYVRRVGWRRGVVLGAGWSW